MKSIALLLLCGALLAQTHGVPTPETSANLPAQKIGPRDLIVIQVYDSPELTRSVRVGADGFDPPADAEAAHQGRRSDAGRIGDCRREALQEEGLLVEPFVTITVAEYSSRPISVAGAVKTPSDVSGELAGQRCSKPSREPAV